MAGNPNFAALPSLWLKALNGRLPPGFLARQLPWIEQFTGLRPQDFRGSAKLRLDHWK
jgi:hypothetical protein